MNQLRDTLDYIIPHPDPAYRITMGKLYTAIEAHITSIVALSIISAFVRSAPALNMSDYDELIQASIDKETSAHERPLKGQQLDYRAIMTVGSHRIPIHTNPWLYSPSVSLMYCEWIYNWKAELHHRIYYPQFNPNKYIGRISDNRCRAVMEQFGFSQDEIRNTSFDLYYLYFMTGITTDGPCEVQFAFKYNDVKPRVYYRIGSWAYWKALYIHDLIDDLMKAFPHTHPRSRYNIQRIEIGRQKAMIIVYDYATFTSNLEELRYFLLALADTIQGTEVLLWDYREGLKPYDAGDLLREYTEECCVNMEYDLGEVLGSDDPLVHLSNLAGLLGVYGNINGSLSLHGLVLCHLCGHPSKCTCIGDDALGVIRRKHDSSMRDRDLKKTVLTAIQVIGDLSLEKTITFDAYGSRFKLDEEDLSEIAGWHYVKRPISCADGYLIQGYLFDLPLPYLLCSTKDSARTVQKPQDIGELRKQLVVSYCSMLDQLHEAPKLSVDDAMLLETYIAAAYRILGIRLEGSMPGHKNIPGLKHIVTPPADQRIFGADWRLYCWENRDEEYFIMDLPSTPEAPDDYDLLEKSPALGYTFYGRMHPSWKFYVAAGFLKTTEMYNKVIIGPEDRTRYMAWLSARTKYYRFTVNDFLPECWLDSCTNVPVPLYSTTFNVDDI